jgi:DNA modification methylase
MLLDLLSSPNPNLRLLVAKNLGKSGNPSYIAQLTAVAESDGSALVRRECVSAIGRIGTEEAIPALMKFLNDADSRIVVQAMRGLVRFRDLPDVGRALRQRAEESEDEVISEFAHVILDSQRDTRRPPVHNGFTSQFANTLVRGDCREVLRRIPDNVLHLSFTSPPYYNARDYSIYRSYQGYLDFLIEVFREVHRVLQEGRFFVLNTSPVLIPRMSRKHQSRRYLIPFDIHPRLIDIGFDFVDDILWVKPDPSAKNRNGGFFQHRKPLMYKTNSVTEYVIVYRKRTNKLIDWNLKQYSAEVIERSRVRDDYEKTNVWRIAPSTNKAHPAVFPKELVKRVIQFYSFVGDVVLDPFAGSGTVGMVASELERAYFLIEQDESYCDYFLNSSAVGLFAQPQYLSQEEFCARLE